MRNAEDLQLLQLSQRALFNWKNIKSFTTQLSVAGRSRFAVQCEQALGYGHHSSAWHKPDTWTNTHPSNLYEQSWSHLKSVGQTWSFLLLESFSDELDAWIIILAAGVFWESSGDRFALNFVLKQAAKLFRNKMNYN